MKLEAKMDAIGLGQIVTGIGRGIALDRDGNYGKIQRAYQALVNGVGRPAPAEYAPDVDHRSPADPVQ